MEFLHRFDPANRLSPIYNRFGHLVCELPDYPGQIAFSFVAADYYMLYISPGDSVLEEIGCRYVVFADAWPNAQAHGFSLVHKIAESRTWIYQRP